MIVAFIIAAVTIAFPKEGQQLPAVDRTYMIGATDGGETNLVIQGVNVAVHPKGGWVTMVDVVAGTNTIEVGGVRRSFRVQKKTTANNPLGQRTSSSVDYQPPTYKKLPYAADMPKPHPVGKSAGEITVVIDAGHGGSDTGAMAPHGRMEKDFNLALAKQVRDELTARGYKVVMTREDDSFPALYDRPKVAHRVGADAFISIHHNAPAFDRDPRGLRYHAVYAWNEIGTNLAARINRRMARTLGATLKSNGVMHANFAVTRNPEIPSCLIEVDFITTPEGEDENTDAARRYRIAASIADGFVDWCQAR